MLKMAILYGRYSKYFKDERYLTYLGVSCNFILLNTSNKHSFLLIYNFLLVSATTIWLREQQFELLCQSDEQINLGQHCAIAYFLLNLKANI